MPAYDILALIPNSPGAGQAVLRVPGVGDTYNFPRSAAFIPGTAANPGLVFSDDLSTGFYKSTGTIVDLSISGVQAFRFSTNGFFFTTSVGSFNLSSGGALQWSSGTAGAAGVDLALIRDAANTLAQRNGANAQAFRVYNTFTDASNFERGFLRWASNRFEIGTEASGTGTVRDLRFFAGAATLFTASASGLVTGSGIDVISSGGITFAAGFELRSTGALRISTPSDGIFRIMSWGNTNGACLESVELAADPAAPAANAGRLYYRDNGSGKTQLCVRFNTGAVQVLATEP